MHGLYWYMLGLCNCESLLLRGGQIMRAFMPTALKLGTCILASQQDTVLNPYIRSRRQESLCPTPW